MIVLELFIYPESSNFSEYKKLRRFEMMDVKNGAPTNEVFFRRSEHKSDADRIPESYE